MTFKVPAALGCPVVLGVPLSGSALPSCSVLPEVARGGRHCHHLPRHSEHVQDATDPTGRRSHQAEGG